MSSYELPDSYEDLKRWLEEKESQQKQFTEQMPEISSGIQADLKAEQDLMVKINEIVRKRREKERQRDLIKNQVKSDQTAMAHAKRRLEQLASERAIEERLKREAQEFDRITQMHQWREFAFEHQIDGARRLASARRGILGDKRGLGKSLTSLIWADMLGAKRVLIFAPKDVLHNFHREIEHWTPHRHAAVLGGMPKLQRDMFLKLLASQEQFLLLCNYEAWRKDEELVFHLQNLRADTIIIDEAHNIKERRTSAFKGIRSIVYAQNKCDICDGEPERYKDPVTGTFRIRCSKCLHEPLEFGDFCSVKNVLPMTGTTILNRPQELWTLLNLVDRTLFPSENAFLQDYCTMDLYTRHWKFRHGGEEALINRLGPRFVRRSKRDIGDTFKPQIIIPHTIEFDKNLYPAQWQIMEQIRKYDSIVMDKENEIALNIIGILPQLMRRRQAITWPRGIKIWEYDNDGRKTGRILYEAPATESIKMDKAMSIAKEILEEDEDRLVVFSQFKEALKEFERRFTEMGVPVVRYDGDISDQRAQQAQLDFDGKTSPNHVPGSQCNEECVNWGKKPCSGYRWQVILCHYKKGGVGLNLNAARQMIILDREWNPGKEDQALGRIDRLDNIRDSIVHTIHVENTIDAFMDNLIEEKKQLIDGFESKHDMIEQLMLALKDGDLM